MTQTFKFSKRSIGNLAKVHPDLTWVLYKALERTDIDFTVIQGIRTVKEQQEMLAKGASTTMHSRHLPNKEGLACAVDIACWDNGKITWGAATYIKQAKFFIDAATIAGIPLEWGGSWRSFKDFGHYQLPWAVYP